MARLLHHLFESPFRKGSTILLAFSFFAGALSSILLVLYNGHFFSLMHSVGAVSIVSHFLCLLLPFLLSAFAVFLSAPGLLYGICFLKSFLFFYVSFSLRLSAGEGGWLCRDLLMFSDCLFLPFLYFYWQRHLAKDQDFRFRECLISLSFVLCLGYWDFRFLIPLAADLF